LALWPCERPQDHSYDDTYECRRCGKVLLGEPLPILALRRGAGWFVRFVGMKPTRGPQRAAPVAASRGPCFGPNGVHVYDTRWRCIFCPHRVPVEDRVGWGTAKTRGEIEAAKEAR
jgi:hypothetical protein